MSTTSINAFDHTSHPYLPPSSPRAQKLKNTTDKVSAATTMFSDPHSPRSKKTGVIPIKAAQIPAPATVLPIWGMPSLDEDELKLPPPTPLKKFSKKEASVAGEKNEENPPIEVSKTAVRNLWGDDEATTTDEKKAEVVKNIAPPPLPKEESPFSILHTSLEKGEFTYNTLPCAVTKFNRGTYFAVYQLTKTPENLVKAHHGGTCHKFYPSILNNLLSHSLQNYSDVQTKCMLPVAELVNKETAAEDMFFIQKKIPHKIDVSNPKHIEQAEKFFAASVKQDIMMDLQPQNLRVTKEGTVVLIDFVEEPDSVFILMTKVCKAWAEHCRHTGLSLEEGKQVLTTLTASFVKPRTQYSITWFNNILTT